MDLLTVYSSDESEEDTGEPKTKLPKHAAESKIDFFNLQGNMSDSVEPQTTYLNNFDLISQAKILINKSYGPVKINDSSSLGGNSCCKQYSTAAFKQVYSNDCKSQSNKSSEFVKSSDYFLKHSKGGTSSSIAEPNIIKPNEIFNNELKECYESNNASYRYIPQYKSTSFLAHDSAITSLCWCRPQYCHLLLTSSIDSNVKLWNMNSSKCVHSVTSTAGIKTAKWSLCGTSVVYGGFDKKISICDVNSGKNYVQHTIENYVSSLEVHPQLENIYVVGTKDAIFAFDKRQSSPIRSYLSNCKYVLDIIFLPGDQEFVCSTEIVTHDSADRTIMVWDFATGALLSNQVYAERYTCPSLSAQSEGKYFAAQSNGDYLVIFGNKRPYKMVNRRYVGHKVSGYNIGCDFNSDGQLLASGDTNGAIYIYSSQTGQIKKKIEVKTGIPTVRVKWHPVLQSTIASAGWDGSVQTWK